MTCPIPENHGGGSDVEPRSPLRVEEAADALGVSRSSMYALIKSGEIVTDGEGRARRIPVDVLDAYLAASKDRGPHTGRPTLGASRSGASVKRRSNQITKPRDVGERSSGSFRRRPEGTRAPNGESSIYLSEVDGLWHGWVTVGIKDDGSPDRRHRKGKHEKDVARAVRELVKSRESGKVLKAGRAWRTGPWLVHWVENIASLKVRDNTLEGYRVAVHHHLVPALGQHWMEKIGPGHFERLYRKMLDAGLRPATAHQVHRTAHTAFAVAEARGLIAQNPVSLATPPVVEDEEIEPYELDEVQLLLTTALKQRNGIRWVLALVFGLRQGEALGLRWPDVELVLANEETLRVRKSRLRPKYKHGCTKPCERKYAGHCPDRIETRPKVGPVKSNAGRRPFPIPAPVVVLLKLHKVTQDQERERAGAAWVDEGWVIATETGEAINPRTDWANWKKLLGEAAVRDGRLHDARHTAATLALLAGVLDRVAQTLFGWSDARNSKRYQHVTMPVQRDAARRIEALVWSPKVALETGTATQGPEEQVF